MIPYYINMLCSDTCVPRLRGDDPLSKDDLRKVKECSPLARG